jgi:hypothetical protein
VFNAGADGDGRAWADAAGPVAQAPGWARDRPMRRASTGGAFLSPVGPRHDGSGWGVVGLSLGFCRRIMPICGA